MRAHYRHLLPFMVVILAAVGVSACGGKKKVLKLPEAQTTTLGINTFLWRASLETLAFMPMAQVDSNGGVILTEWYTNPKVPGERVKVSAFILDKDMRADAVRVTALRQENRGGAWVDVPVRADTVQKLEDAILTRARQLRQGAVAAASN